MSAKRILGLAAGLALVAGAAWADEPFVPQALVQQGRLLDSNDQPVNGSVSMTFNLYHQATGGTAVWTETQSIQVANGYYAVRLGDPADANAQPITTDDLAGPTYLGITIDNNELLPRLQLATVPYAQRADLANRMQGGTIDGATITNSSVDATSVSVGGHPVIDSNGNIVNLAQQLQGAGMVASDSSELGGKPASDYVTSDVLGQYATSADLAAQEYDNRVRNGSFELGSPGDLPTDWVTLGSGTGTRAQVADPLFGASALEINDSDSSGQVAVQQTIIASSDIAGAIGETFTASVYAKRKAGSTQGRVCLEDDGGTDCAPLTTGSTYARASVSHVITSGATSLVLVLDSGTIPGDANDYVFDGAMVTRGKLVVDFAPQMGEQMPSLLPDASIPASKLVMGPGSGLNADLLDGIDSTGFVQTQGDQTVGGTKTFTSPVSAPSFTGSGSGLTNIPDGALSSNIPRLDGSDDFKGADTFSTAPTFAAPGGQPFTVSNANAQTVTNLSSDKLDGIDSTQFMRSDTDTSTSGNLSVSGNVSAAGVVTGDRFKSSDTLLLSSYQTANPSSNVGLYSAPGDRDSWVFLDSADTSTNWGIYHRQIDTPLAIAGQATLEPNSIAFVGGGTSTLQAFVGLGTGNAYFKGNVTIGGSISASGNLILSLFPTPQIKEFSFAGLQNFDVALPAAVQPGMKAILADVFATADSNDHQVFVLGNGCTSYQRDWIDTRGTQPSTVFGDLATQCIHLVYNGEADGYTSNYGLWYSSQVIPLKSNGHIDFSNFANSGSNGWIYMVIRGYFQ